MITEHLSREVSASLWAVYHKRPEAPHLIFPLKRDDSTRVSEQESKLLITQWLERNGLFYSIETPTREMYTQSGNARMSARIDVTVYGSRDPADRVLNLELKAGMPGLEAFRKDFEKLLREGKPGLWYHTLTNASDATWRSIEDNVRKALDRLFEHTETATNSVYFAFCVLDPPRLVEFDLDFSTDWREQLGQRFHIAQRSPLRPEWTPKAASINVAAARTTAHRSYSGSQRKMLVYVPSIESRSFIHLSIKGDSYAFRSFGGARPLSRWVEPDCKTTTELLARHPIKHQVDVAGEKKNLQSELGYWATRVADLNIKHGMGGL
jgi:hypothetical protein